MGPNLGSDFFCGVGSHPESKSILRSHRVEAPRLRIHRFAFGIHIGMKHLRIFEEFENEGEYIPPVQIECNTCGWNWNSSQSNPEDMYVCHKCGSDNKRFYKPDEVDD